MLVVNIDEQNDVTHFPDLEVDVEVENEEEAGIPFINGVNQWTQQENYSAHSEELDASQDNPPSPSQCAAFLSAVVQAAATDTSHPTRLHPQAPIPDSATLQTMVSPTFPGTRSNGLDGFISVGSQPVAQYTDASVLGRFSPAEVTQIDAAIDSYRNKHDLNDADIRNIILHKGKKKEMQTFWDQILTAIEGRPSKHIRAHLQRRYDPKNQLGVWTLSEDKALIQAVADLGSKWVDISQLVGRTSSDCRDRYRNHLAHRDVRKTGRWSKDEENKLKEIVSEMEGQARSTLWTEVSKKMGGTRTRQQCSEKWTSLTRDPKSNAGPSGPFVWKSPKDSGFYHK